MTYRKIIRYGKNIEIFDYEREPFPFDKRRKKYKSEEELSGSEKEILKSISFGKRKDNAHRAANVFRRLVASNLSEKELPLLITITYKENMKDLSIGYKDYRHFVQALRNKYGKNFKYICVPEFQKRGAVHFHALFWSLPKDVFLEERETRTIANVWGKGFVYMKETDGNEKLSSYLAKYMAKAFTDPRLKNQKAYTASKNISRPLIDSGNFSFGAVIDEYTENGELVKEENYRTSYLGECNFKHYRSLN